MRLYGRRGRRWGGYPLLEVGDDLVGAVGFAGCGVAGNENELEGF
jgi:hypothetical protein